MLAWCRGLLLASLGVTVCLSVAYAQDDCATCEDEETPFPEAAQALADLGLPPEDYTVLLTWQETARLGKKQVVAGYRVKPHDEGAPFDLYVSEKGKILGAKERMGLGILEKNWNLRPMTKFAELPPFLSRASDPPPVPAGVAKGITPVHNIFLRRLNVQRLIEEDETLEATTHKGSKRIGVVRRLPRQVVVLGERITHGRWLELSDRSKLWSLVIRSPEAKGQRIHFSAIRMPRGAKIVVYNLHDPQEAYGPYQRPAHRDSELWTPTCFSDAVVVECHAKSFVDLRRIYFRIDKITHNYADFGSVQWQKAEPGPCNLDASCFPEWSIEAKSVAGIGTVSASNALFCTGTLIADTDPATNRPYFLTANHCVSGQTGTRGASSVEVYWLYQTQSCGGSPPSIASVPRTTGGADYLAGTSLSMGSDFTLLRLRNQPPAEIPFAGWSSAPWDYGTEVTCIHHPRGSYKRITFGAITDRFDVGLQQPRDRYYQITWSDGTTEPGSSGSPIFLSGQQLIIGQLWGGLASCGAPLEPDYYGRFDVTYPIIADYLNPVSENGLDVNKDGAVNSEDVQIVINAALDLPTGYITDLNGDGATNSVDIQLVILAALS